MKRVYALAVLILLALWPRGQVLAQGPFPPQVPTPLPTVYLTPSLPVPTLVAPSIPPAAPTVAQAVTPAPAASQPSGGSTAPEPSPPAATSPEAGSPSSGTPSPSPSKKLSKGAITEAQWLLRSATGQTVKVTGKVDSETAMALMKFQEKNGLEATGKLDEPSLQALKKPVLDALHRLAYDQGEYRDALRAFQQSHKLNADGAFGPKTMTTLQAATEVRHFQEVLQASGGYTGPLNGNASDPAFQDSLKAFQKAHNLPPSGDLDPATRQALKSAASPSPSPVAATPSAPAPAASAPPWLWFVGGMGTMLLIVLATKIRRR